MKTETTSQKTMSSNSIDTNSERKIVDLLFSKFAAFYGHIWRSQFKDEGFLKFAKKEWTEALSEFSDKQITKAILGCREFYELPPTLPQMIRCCRDIKKQTVIYLKPDVQTPPDKAVVAYNLNKCREFLANNKENTNARFNSKNRSTDFTFKWGYKSESA